MRLDDNLLLVHFNANYEYGRWARRTATTLKSWFITETPLKGDIALKWTDNRAQTILRNVPVQYLEPARPAINHPAMIIAGDKIGFIGDVVQRSRGKGPKQVLLRDNEITLTVPESDLCRLADPEVLSVSEIP